MITWGLLGWWWFLTGDLEDKVIFDIIDYIGRWIERYPESFMKIQHDLADWLHLGLGGCWEFLTEDLEDGVIFGIIYHVGRRLGRYYENLMKMTIFRAIL